MINNQEHNPQPKQPTLYDLFLDEPEQTPVKQRPPNVLNIVNSLKELNGGNYHLTSGSHIAINLLIAQAMNVDCDGDALSQQAGHMKSESNSKQMCRIRTFNESYKDVVLNHTHEAMYAIVRMSKRVHEKLNGTLLDEVTYVNKINFNLTELHAEPWRTIEYKGVRDTMLNTILSHVSKIDMSYRTIGQITKSSNNDFMYSIRKHDRYFEIVHALDMFYNVLSSTGSDTALMFTMDDFDFPEQMQYSVKNEPALGVVIQDIYVENSIESLKKSDNMFYKMIEAKVGLKQSNLSSAFSAGFTINNENKTIESNTVGGLIHGISSHEYHMNGDGARSAFLAKENTIPKAGDLSRTGYLNLGIVWQDENLDDCGSTETLDIYITDSNKGQFHGSNYKGEDGSIKRFDLDVGVDVNKTYKFYSPMTCKASDFRICKKCWHNHDDEFIKYIGTESISKIIEIIIQGSLGAHHTSGAFGLDFTKRFRELVKEYQPYEYKSSYITFKKPMTDEAVRKEFITEWKSMYDSPDDLMVLDNGLVFRYKIIKTPVADNANKRLNKTLSLINKTVDVKSKDWISMRDSYDLLIEESKTNRYSKFFELILSALYFDEDGVLSRESGKEPTKKIAMSKLLLNVDTQNVLLHNYSESNLREIQCRSLGIPTLKKNRKDVNFDIKSHYGDLHHPYDNLFKFTESSDIEWFSGKNQ